MTEKEALKQFFQWYPAKDCQVAFAQYYKGEWKINNCKIINHPDTFEPVYSSLDHVIAITHLIDCETKAGRIWADGAWVSISITQNNQYEIEYH